MKSWDTKVRRDDAAGYVGAEIWAGKAGVALNWAGRAAGTQIWAEKPPEPTGGVVASHGDVAAESVVKIRAARNPRRPRDDGHEVVALRPLEKGARERGE
jgi:hypothetical protein